MTQHLTEEEIAISADVLNTKGYNDLPVHLREHLEQCDQCAGKVLLVAEVAGKFDFKLEPEKPVKEKTQQIIAWSLSAAAAVALTLLIIEQEVNPFKENQLLSKNSTTEQIIKSSDTEISDTETSEQKSSEQASEQHKEISTSDNHASNSQSSAGDSEFPTGSASSSIPPVSENCPDTLKFLAHYTPDETLEKLVNRFEGILRDNGDIVINSPVNITTHESSLVIKWENPERKRLIIEVLDNEGKQLMETETDQEEYTISKPSAGLYYWKLFSGSEFDLLFCDKIIVE